MSQLLKLFGRVRNNPKTVKFEELDKLLLAAEFKRRQPRSGSSHYFYSKDGKYLSVPRKSPYIKETYVEKAIEAIGDYFDK